MSTTIAPGTLAAVGEALLECVSAELADTAAGAPAHAYLVPGSQVAFDRCHCGGQLTIHIRSMWPSEVFPAQVLTPLSCAAPFTAVEYVVTVLRCAPTVAPDGKSPPTGAQIEAAAVTDWADREAVRRGVLCCQLSDPDRRKAQLKMALQEHLGVGAEGQCVGSELHVVVGFPNCEEC